MKEQTVFEIIHNMDQMTNQLIVEWNKLFSQDLGISHILVLGHLSKHGRNKPSMIAQILGLRPPTLTHLSEKLVKRKLVARLTDENDRRIIYLEITDEGRNVLNHANEKGKILRKELFEKLTTEEIRQLTSIYQKLNS